MKKQFLLVSLVSFFTFCSYVQGQEIESKEPPPEQKNEKPFIIVEVPAKFQGGDLMAFRNWIASKTTYPKEALDSSAEGMVILQFTVNSKGYVSNINILKSSGNKYLDAEAFYVINSSPQWEAAMQDGKNVSQLFNMPIVFKLSSNQNIRKSNKKNKKSK